MTPLCELAKRHQTDKGGHHLKYGGGDSDTCHNYTPIYHDMYGARRESTQHVLEIGVNSGSSLRMWKEYFPNAVIVGLDSNAQALIHSEHRIMCLPADQGDAIDLMRAMAKLDPDAPKFDLIIDDGSHELGDQIVSLKALLPFLSDNGFYIVEDLGSHFVPATLIEHVPVGYQYLTQSVVGGIGKSDCTEFLFIVWRDA